MDSTEHKHEGAFKNRRKSRELALQTLYACEIGSGGDDWRQMLNNIADSSSFSPDVVNYASELVKAVYDNRESLDEMIRDRAANWDLKRMAAIDRNILRLSIAELRFFPDTPVKVVIDEAVELAKLFGTDDSGKFVNGIIDSINKKLKGQSGTSGKEGFQHG
ncbi:MAG: transcription antitermination factor NusB [Chitinispirillaceae bacterium]|nr:transcription antitermination factor NusB [Chitinispirillaceae bacterium]